MEGEAIHCPACGAVVEPPEHGHLLVCPVCGEQFFAPDAEDDTPALDVNGPHPQEDELDGLRIRNIVHLRRSNIRARTHALVFAICFAVGAIQFVFMIVRVLRQHIWFPWPELYIAGAGLCVWGSVFFFRKTLSIHRELQELAATPPPPAVEPSFDELSDGSQRVKNLEEM